ncbi:uncharacterized protein EI90DRAFT_3032823 [Cantharellus anzutake]|uniref:uncharacterized protein n=1 Tax=Cantharellus anzutake TaxID=1750568 RepID=UPI0019033BC6|nr:uncharacterized protein EI90DRAFT_3032823 [Cantharellus anzutake]KAF8342300.1 hypothetical protein EI90DRAFT_3032823 [Cantharellus anzutake]
MPSNGQFSKVHSAAPIQKSATAVLSFTKPSIRCRGSAWVSATCWTREGSCEMMVLGNSSTVIFNGTTLHPDTVGSVCF